MKVLIFFELVLFFVLVSSKIPNGCIPTVREITGLSITCYNANFYNVMEHFRNQELYIVEFDGCNPSIGRLKRIPNVTFYRFEIKNCGIEKIDDDAFADVYETIGMLDLRYNSITNFPNLSHWPVLNSVYLSHNKITKIPANSLPKTRWFTYFHIENNRLTEITPFTFAGVNLRMLALSCNNITYVAPETFQMESLKFLFLSYNNITSLPKGIFDFCPNLLISYLDHNKLSELPPDIFKFTRKLLKLDLSYNNFHKLDTKLIWSLTDLTLLNLEHNYLKKLPKELLYTAISLRSFNAANNNLECIDYDFFKNTFNIYMVVLNNNKLTELPAEVFRSLFKIELIDLKNNSLVTLTSNVFTATSPIDNPKELSPGSMIDNNYRILLHGNPIHCDKNIEWLIPHIDELYDRYDIPYETVSTTSSCVTPEKFAGIPINKIKF
uniref:LRRCT domain-containing protein n=1 Tax=Panagrellus redivivus TaxID=6233 RepID=A0A7E4VF66_PANRE